MAHVNKLSLSAAQQRLWILSHSERATYLYHIPMIVKLGMVIEQSQLSAAIQSLAIEQPELTAYFFWKENEIEKGYQPVLTCEIESILLDDDMSDALDLSKIPALLAFFTKPFDLAKPPLWRLAIVTAGNCHYLMFCFHHLLMDAWSAGIFVERLGQLYLNQDVTQRIPYEQSYQYYVAREKYDIANHAYANHLQYWEKKLNNKTWQINLPYDNSLPSKLSDHGHNIRQPITASLWSQLVGFAKDNKISMQQLCLAAWQLLLHRYSQQDVITIGIPIANRWRSTWRYTIGMFVNTYLCQITIHPELTVTAYLQQVRQEAALDLPHTQVPYDLLLRHFYQQQMITQGSSFNVLFNFIHIQTINFAQTIVQFKPVLMPISKFDLSLHLYASETDGFIVLEYPTDYFTAATIKQLAEHYLVLLTNLVADNQQKLKDIHYMTSDEWSILM